MMWTDDPITDFNKWDAEQSDWLERRPHCVNCGEPIQDDYFYMINDEPVCADCLESDYKKETEDYLE